MYNGIESSVQAHVSEEEALVKSERSVYPIAVGPLRNGSDAVSDKLLIKTPKMLAPTAKLSMLAAILSPTLACLGYEGGVPTPTASYSNSAVIEIASGETFDAGWARYDRGSGACTEQAEGGDSDAVFLLRSGATLKNVIIGANQAEGVHCDGPCTLEFVWFEDVCEDAITIKNDEAGEETWIIGGGAYYAADKIVQHNGCGTVNIINFYAYDYGKVYRSCGNCESQCQRNVYVEGTTAYDGGAVVGINSNYGDTATLVNVCTDYAHPCVMYIGNDDGDEPTQSGYCSG